MFKQNKKFSELSKKKKIYVIVLSTLLVLGCLYIILNFKELASVDYKFTNRETGEVCIEHYEYGKLVGDECTEFREAVNAQDPFFNMEAVDINLS